MNGRHLTLGSLFDGSGGFPFGAIMTGIRPIWCSEIEPFPILVTSRRMPQVKHLGDVRDINGSEIEPVDIITFGSPCQDMSIAGRRTGLDGERSGLFFEAIRIISEMREKTNGEKPRYIVWENVPGAFSSNGGEDFRAVLNAVVGIRQSGAEVPPPEGHKWPAADVVLGDGWSVAYRTLDAQYWGVPQRRRRIYLVADFAGEDAGKILFESEGVSGYTPQSFSPWKRASGDTEGSAGTSVRAPCLILNDQGGSRMDVTEDVTCTLRAESQHPPVVMDEAADPVTLKIRCGKSGGGKGVLLQKDMSATLGCNNDQTVFVPKAYGVCAKASHSMLSDNPKSGFYEAKTSRTLDRRCAEPTCAQGGIAVLAFAQNQRDEVRELGSSAGALAAEPGMKQQTYVLQGSMIDRRDGNGPEGCGLGKDVSFTLNGSDRHAVNVPERYSASKNTRFMTSFREQTDTLVATDYKDPPLVNEPAYIVRRLTPVECARLQGFPDWWCDGIDIPNPTGDEMAFWVNVFETMRKAVSPAKRPKTENQIRKWLANPYSDSAQYRMWGNGVALPCVCFVLAGIAWAAGRN